MLPITKKLTFGDVYLHDNYLIAVMHQGITLRPEHNSILVNIANDHYNDRPFAYITHRKNSYAVDPSIYYETSKIENLVAFAVVSNKDIDSKTVPVEKMFFNKPFMLFSDLDEAVSWVLQEVEKKR